MVNGQAAAQLLAKHGSPLYVYDGAWLSDRIRTIQDATSSLDCIIRYAVKANPHPEIVRLFEAAGLHFDASSDYEAEELISAGIAPEKISLSSQQPPKDILNTLKSGVKFVATSLHQLDLVNQSGWRGNIAVRINPGVGSGHSKRTTTGGVGASFGIWHEYLPDVINWQKNSGCVINRLHVHVGAGVDAAVWREVMRSAVQIARQLPDVATLDIGGGYKIARMPEDKGTDIAEVMKVFSEELANFQTATGRKLGLEIEPGTWLTANGGTLLATIVDIVDTGKEGYRFIKLDTGMNDILRPGMYGAQHPITVLNDARETGEYVVVGHNCETGDILTPAPNEPEELAPRELNRSTIGDIVAIGGAGAYCASMSAHGYNSFPSAGETVI